MQKNNILNILKFASKPSNALVMTKKVLKRFSDTRGQLTRAEYLEWLKHHYEDFATFTETIDSLLWKEAEAVGANLKKKTDKILSQIDWKLGGGGFGPLLYFVTHYLKPYCVVETGVAAEYTSQVFLQALKENDKGVLYSSDFPYFRLPNPERYIGILVDKKLRNEWKLYINEDEKNLPKILSQVTNIDIFHYDSDKNYSGRDYAISAIEDKMSSEGIIIMNDIQDNSFFHDYITQKNIPSFMENI